MDFEEEFRTWLDQSFAKGVPDEVKAFSFNLFEPARSQDVKYEIELIGSSDFDENSSEWLFEEVWEPEQRHLEIPMSFSGDDQEDCLIAMKELVRDYLMQESDSAKALRSRLAVAIGFVDGDLELLWMR